MRFPLIKRELTVDHATKHCQAFYFVQWCECYARCDWSLPTIYQSTDTWMTSRETCFLFFVQHGARFWICLWDYFGLKQVNSSKNVQQELFTRKKNGETGTEELLTTLECLNYKKSSQQLPSCFIAMRDSPFCKMFSPLFCFEQGKTSKDFSKKLYTIKMKKNKKKQRRKVALET